MTEPMVWLRDGGGLAGRWQGETAAFLGIPYATAARFQPPDPVPPWKGVRDATRPGPIAPQLPSQLTRVVGPQSPADQSEDCLNLNVWTPGTTKPRPVLVFVHGGGFLTGAGSLAWYDGARLASRGDMVVVTINYRLGALGFLRDNAGLRDIRAALRWVRDNIAAFGGDPDWITAAGQSGGALALLNLLSERNLFHQAILQSLPAGMLPAAEPADRLGPRPEQLPVDHILARQVELAAGVEPPFQLVADGELVAADPVESARTDIPIMIGYTRDEAAAFLADDDLAERLIRGPSHRLAEVLAQQGNSPLLYRFDWHPPGSPFGACHCIELPFVFGNLDAWRDAPMLAGAESLTEVVDAVQPTWISLTHNQKDIACTPTPWLSTARWSPSTSGSRS